MNGSAMSCLPTFRRYVLLNSVRRESLTGFQEWIKEIGDQLKTAPLTKNPDAIVVSKMYGPSTVLLGDAAHVFSPNLGIGFVPNLHLTRI